MAWPSVAAGRAAVSGIWINKASSALTTAMAMPSADTRTVLKMPVAMPTFCGATTLTAIASIRPHGMPMPMPIRLIGNHRPAASVAMTSASHTRPTATASKPAADRTPGLNQRVSNAARNGTTNRGAARPIISWPAASAL
ncbi:hypothetical protein D3C71_1751470 [compost metagenome]